MLKNLSFLKSDDDILKRAKSVCKDPAILKALDQTKTSSRAAVKILSPAVVLLAKDIRKVPMSQSTLEKNRKEMRSEVAKEIRDSFEPPKRAVVHFDGKHLSDLGGDMGERLAVVLSGDTCKEGKVLSCNMIKNSTGKEQAKEVINSLEAGALKLLGSTKSQQRW